jgi:nucleotide-binding universal stress UspA family protein
MEGWKRICCAVDFSEHSWSALRRAIELARLLEAELTVLHVAAHPFPGGEALFPTPAPAVEAEEERSREQLEAWRCLAEQALGRMVRARLLVGSAPREIARFSARGTDLLVVGTRGPSGLGRLLLGSVAERVVRDASCPVMVIHRQDEPAESVGLQAMQ